jgi:hypothetical protein
MHRNKITHIFILLLALLALHSGSAFAASISPADVYIPFSQNKTEWNNTICQHATAGGCAYFRAYEAEPAWFALNALNASGVRIRFKDIAADFGSELKLWHLELTVFTSSGDSQTHEIYATVLTHDGAALLDRVIVLDQTLLATE